VIKRVHRRQTNRNAMNAAAAADTALPPLVGRRTELQWLEDTLARTADGQGSAVFLAGEIGIGKTRLAHEALVLAQARGFLALKGRAFPLEGGLAYAPILDALGAFLRGLEPIRRTRLAEGLLDLGRLFADLHLSEPESLGDPALEKTRLFDAVARLLERLARESPVVLFLDDLHWADTASIELLHYLARRVEGQRMLLLGTYREAEVDAARGLGTLVGSLRRGGIAQERVVLRLAPDAVADLVRGILDGEVAPELVAAVDARSGGVPLFIAALIQASRDSEQITQIGRIWTLVTPTATDLPASIRDTIAERLERLQPLERQVLDLIAVSGQAMPFRMLQAMTGLSGEPLLATLQRLRIAGLVEEDPGGQDVTYGLSHPLIQEVAYGELSVMARRRAHAAFVATLEQQRPDDLEHLAYHYQAAGPEVEQDRALAILLAAGERASAAYANDQAARHFGAALTLVHEGRRMDLLPRLLERLGEAWDRVGEGGAATAVWTEALDHYQQAGDVLAEARLRRLVAMAEWDRGHFDAAQMHLDRGLETLAGREPSAETADLLHARTIILGRLGHYDQFAETARELVSVAERLGSAKVMAEAHLAQASALMGSLDLLAGQEEARCALAAAERAGESFLAQRAHDQLHLIAYTLGEPVTMCHHCEASLALAQRLGAASLELFPRIRLAMADLLLGNWEEAVRASGEAVAMARRLGARRGLAGALSVQALIQVHRGDLKEAGNSISEAYEVFGGDATIDRNIFDYVAAVELMLALEQGKQDAIVTAADRVRRMGAAGGVQLLVPALLAEAEVATGKPDQAMSLAEGLVAQVPSGNVYVAALAGRVEGLARRSLGQRSAAIACLERASAAFTAAEMPFETARVRLEWARLAVITEPTEGAAAAQESLAAFERLGARRYAAQTRRLLNELGVRPLRPPRPASPACPLSPRELEIVGLVAEDLTNAAIAERLFLSRRTVTTHLDRIYARLDIHSRAALVRYAFEAGLLPLADRSR